jgi:hypothetical protein
MLYMAVNQPVAFFAIAPLAKPRAADIAFRKPHLEEARWLV